MPVDTASRFASVIQEHLELKRRNAALEHEMPLEKYMTDDPFENHPLFKTEEQARVEDTMDGVQSIVDEPTSLDWPGLRGRVHRGAEEAEAEEDSDEASDEPSGRARATSTGATDGRSAVRRGRARTRRRPGAGGRGGGARRYPVAMPELKTTTDYRPTGDQPKAIETLAAGLAGGRPLPDAARRDRHRQDGDDGLDHREAQRPALVIAHNKTLAAQLCNEFREFFPHNAVEYFVSYYDYYQPEAYVPQADLYIEKDSSRNDDIDRLRHAATSNLLSRRDIDHRRLGLAASTASARRRSTSRRSSS